MGRTVTMRMGMPRLTVVVLLLMIGTLTIGVIAETFATGSHIENREGSILPNPVSRTVPETPQASTPAEMIPTGLSQMSVSPSSPHYFLQDGKAATRDLASTSSNNLLYNGGPTIHVSTSYAIFWLPAGNSFEQSPGNNSAYISLIERFLNETSGSSYYNILNQYPDNINGAPLDKSILGGSYIDKTPYPRAGTRSDPLHDTDIQVEIARAMAANNWTAASGIFHVFTGYGIESCFDARSTECTYNVYCAYHNFFMQGTQSIIYSNMPDFNLGYNRCIAPGQSSPNDDYYADPEINILSHELFESTNDPLLNAWIDSFGAEIGDKCAWNFGTTGPDGSNLVLNGHKYTVQLEWSNYDVGCTLSYGPAHSVSIAPSPGSNAFPSTISFNVSYTSERSHWWSTTAYARGSLTIRVDQNTQITIANKTSTVEQTEEWCFDQNCSGVSASSGAVVATTYYYFDLLAQQVSVAPAVGVPSASLVYSTGSLQPSTLGLPRQLTVQASQTPQTIWTLRGAGVSIASPTNSGINTRWVTRVSRWIISYTSQIPSPIVYYPQYLTTFGYTVNGGGFYSPPTVTYDDVGLTETTLAGVPVWVDSNSAYSYQSDLPGSTQYERWSATSPTGFLSAAGSGISANYYHEYNVTVSYQFTGGGPSASPDLIGETAGLGSQTTLLLRPTTIWLDAGSTYSLTSTLQGPSTMERWQAAGAVSGIVGSAMVLSPTYVHQYFLSVTGSLSGSSGQGWYDSGSSALATSPGVYGQSATVRDRLTYYSVDNGHLVFLNTVNTVTVPVTMDLPHSIRFSSRAQYLLTSVLAPNSIDFMTLSPTGDSWYDDGTSVSVILNSNWNVVGGTRQSLVSYSIDIVQTSVNRASGSAVDLPLITMVTGHVLSDLSVTQYFISVQGATVSGSQTSDGWFDSGSQFNLQGSYSQSYAADFPYYVYAIPVGFQVLANTTLSSLLWTGSNSSLSFGGSHVGVSVYIPAELNLAPIRVLDDGASIVFSYSQVTHVLSFTGSSRFQVSLSSSAVSSSPMPWISDWVLYPGIIAAVVAVILLVGLLLVRRSARKTET